MLRSFKSYDIDRIVSSILTFGNFKLNRLVPKETTSAVDLSNVDENIRLAMLRSGINRNESETPILIENLYVAPVPLRGGGGATWAGPNWLHR